METLVNQKNRRLAVMWHMAWPAILEQLLGTLVSYADTGMVGVLGKGATAAVAINAAPLWLVNGVLSGIGVGYSVQVANAVGARDEEKARRVTIQALLACITVGIAFLAVIELLGGFIPMWLGVEPQVLPDAVRYLRLYALGLPGSAALYILSAVLRCTGDTKTPLCLNAAANVINIVFNFFLIYATRPVDLLGHTVTIPGAGIGVGGAAAASAISLLFSGAVMTCTIIRRGRLFSRGSGDSLRPDGVIIRTAASLGLPYIAERMSINLGQIAMTRIIASIGTTALAAHHIANTAEGMCYLPAYGVSFAATALVGQAVGAQNREDAKAYGALAGKIGFGLCVVTGAVLFVAAYPLAGLFTPDQEVKELTALVLRIVSFCEPFFALSIVLSGALRGANDTRYPMLVCLCCVWVVRIVLTLCAVFLLHLELAGAWAAMGVDLFFRGVLCTLRWRSGKWQRFAGFTPST